MWRQFSMNSRLARSVLLFALPLLQPLGFLGPRTLGEADGRKEVFGVIGSSVLLDPERGADLSDSVEWEFTGSDGNRFTILDYAPGNQPEEPNQNFKSRLRYFTSNGSLMINNLKPIDQGVYTIVNGHWKWSTDLKLIEPLSVPLINSTYVGTTIILACQVSAGKATSIVWMKDGKIISITERYQLVKNNSRMIILDAIKSDCGMYTCTVENSVSKKNISNPLSIYGFPRLHYYTKQLAIVALITAVVALICKAISVFKDSTSLQLLKTLLQVVQFASLIALSGYWIWIEGPHRNNVLLLVFFCLLEIPFALSISGGNWLIKNLKANLCCLKGMGEVTTSGSISVLCASIFLIVKLKDRADNECGPADNLQATLILAVMVPFILSFIVFTVYILYRNHNKGRPRAPSLNVTGSHQPECLELMDHHLNSAALGGKQSCPESEPSIPRKELV
ncbi:hepatocyte cell adhesion molecule-like isoform X1 [Scyliorhinus canicula]|uniref:hepatocyte cell adhesion molecule-like isoform X1 n=1 Tax=Scyliorhinus canicula TaxID=7830 RepID=UPI0018F7A76C|nr:hepatocyte cell adhesion molecule-like isoform X1 [Scyliorhinus canicula]